MQSLPWIIAHRGNASEATENTIAAFESAIRIGADMIEMDIHRLADGELVVFHDDRIGKKELKAIGYGELYEHTLKLHIEIPTFDQVLSVCAGRVRLVVELKNDCASEVLQVIRNARMGLEEYLLACFDSDILLGLRKVHPGIKTALLTENIGFREAQGRLDLVKPNFWAPDQATLDDVTLKSCEEYRIRLLPWTVNDPPTIRRFLSAKSVSGIITDRTREALEIRRELGMP